MLLYRLLLSLAAPLLVAGVLLRVLRGRARWCDLLQRLGLSGSAAEGPVVWLHAASVGEAASARPLVEAALARDPALHILLTCNSPTGRARVESWELARLHPRLAPLDLRACTGGLLRRWQPRALWTLEAEIWPNRFALCAARGLPVAWIAARLSDRAARRWGRLPGVVGALKRAVRLISAQDAGSEDRLRALGLPGEVFVPRIGLKGAAAAARPPEPPAFAHHYVRAQTWLAASTHAGEEEIVLDAFARARAARPTLRLILAPRHPDRGGQVARLIAARGLPVCRRSGGATPGPDTPVYLADTLGEMPLWYAMSGACFVGGSLVDKGGHTPFEPAMAGCAILHGPHLSNFADSYGALRAAGAALEVQDAETLALALDGLTAERQAGLARAARDALRDDSDPGNRLLDLMARVPGLVPAAPPGARA